LRRAAGDGGPAQRGVDGSGDGAGCVSVQHQKLVHFVANSAWSDEKVLAKVGEQ
jgi:hypothetical protein